MQYICVFEDNQYSKIFPLVHTKIVFCLRWKIFSAFEGINGQYTHPTSTLFCRNFSPGIIWEWYACRIHNPHATHDACLFLRVTQFSFPLSI